MIRYSNSYIRNNETGEDVEAKAHFPLKVRDAVIGGGLAVGGVLYMLVKAFKFGAQRFDEGHTQTLTDLGLLDRVSENGVDGEEAKDYTRITDD